MTMHFIAALKIPSLQTTKDELCKAQNGAVDSNNTITEEVDDEDENDVNTNMDIEATGLEAAAKDTSSTSFQAGNIIGKIMAFISQLWLSGENIHDYLKKICISCGCPPLEIKVWVHTWGSLSDCFCDILIQRKVFKLLDTNNMTSNYR